MNMRTIIRIETYINDLDMTKFTAASDLVLSIVYITIPNSKLW